MTGFWEEYVMLCYNIKKGNYKDDKRELFGNFCNPSRWLDVKGNYKL